MSKFTVTRKNTVTGQEKTKTVEASSAFEATRKVISNALMANGWHVEKCIDEAGNIITKIL